MKDDNEGPNRQLNIKFSEDKLEAYVSIVYSSNSEHNYPPKFSVVELKSELSKANVIYGLIEENIKKCSQMEIVQGVLIAKGSMPIDGEDDMLSIKFEVDSDIRKLNEDSKGRVDFKSIGAVNSVLKGEVIAALIPGKEGTAGKDVTGKPLKPKARKIINLKASQGCEMLNQNTIVASIDGKPSMKNNTFYVYKTHQIAQDVDLKTGNIGFLGDIVVQGNVREGMKIYSGNSITIMQNVDRADIKGKGDIIINGNVIGANIVGGGEDSEKLAEIESLNELQKLLKEMIAAIEEIKKFNLLGYDISDGHIIKLLLENKFKAVPKLCMLLIPQSLKNKQRGDLGLEEVLNFVKSKLLGLSPLNIKHYSEFFSFLDLIKERLDALNNTLSIPVNVKISYCQDAEISSSGDIIISGRGAYVSHITAHHNVYFTQQGSTVRGGSIKAGNELKCKQVGSSGGVVTILSVSEKGHIWIDTAYENTLLSVGNRDFVIDFASKNVHAYLDDRSDIVIDRLKL